MWESITSDNLRPPDRYAWYCRKARDLIERFDKAIWQAKGEHVPVPENFWTFEDRRLEDDPDWNATMVTPWQLYSSLTEEQSVAYHHKRWRHKSELDPFSNPVHFDDPIARALENIEVEDIGSNIEDSRAVIPQPDWRDLPYVTFIWGPSGCGKTALAEVVGWMMHNMTDEDYQFVRHKFTELLEASDSGRMLFGQLLSEVVSLENRVVLLDNLIDLLPDPAAGESAAAIRQEMLKELSYEVRTGRMSRRLRNNRSVLIITSRCFKQEDYEELLETQAHYNLRVPETDAERGELERLRTQEGG